MIRQIGSVAVAGEILSALHVFGSPPRIEVQRAE
jgi:hypothetical protein